MLLVVFAGSVARSKCRHMGMGADLETPTNGRMAVLAVGSVFSVRVDLQGRCDLQPGRAFGLQLA